MVFISDKKYACETCIKGHRSSSCKHTDRPLFEIKKKGRPVTQCEHCRELRKTKQVHVKCICESKGEIVTGPPAPKRGGTKIPESATFPNGLPEALEASAALHFAEGTSSDSDHGGIHNSCSCAYGGECHCCTPRKSAPRTKKKADAPQPTATSPSASNLLPHVIARVAEMRVVLPRPPGYGEAVDIPSHDPSAGVAHGHAARHHDNLLYSPYGRAYGLNHLHTMVPQAHASDGQLPDISKGTHPTLSDMLQQQQQHLPQMQAPEASNSWAAGFDPASAFLSACDCGDGCRCPGCIFHRAAGTVPSSSALNACTNPSSCSACLDCFLRIPASPPPDTALSIYNSSEVDAIDEWMRQIPSATSQVPDSELFASAGVDDQQRYPSPHSWPGTGNPSDFGVPGGYNQTVGMYTGTGSQNGYSTERQQVNRRPDMYNRASSSPSALGVSWQNPGLGEFSRSRSPSTSSQSSHEHIPSEAVAHPSLPLGRVQGYFSNANGARSLPQLMTSNGLHKFTTSRSPPSSSPSIVGPTYAISNPDSESSLEEFVSPSQYDPSFEGLRIR